jgi:hypothetical protein
MARRLITSGFTAVSVATTSRMAQAAVSARSEPPEPSKHVAIVFVTHSRQEAPGATRARV